MHDETQSRFRASTSASVSCSRRSQIRHSRSSHRPLASASDVSDALSGCWIRMARCRIMDPRDQGTKSRARPLDRVRPSPSPWQPLFRSYPVITRSHRPLALPPPGKKKLSPTVQEHLPPIRMRRALAPFLLCTIAHFVTLTSFFFLHRQATLQDSIAIFPPSLLPSPVWASLSDSPSPTGSSAKELAADALNTPCARHRPCKRGSDPQISQNGIFVT